MNLRMLPTPTSTAMKITSAATNAVPNRVSSRRLLSRGSSWGQADMLAKQQALCLKPGFEGFQKLDDREGVSRLG